MSSINSRKQKREHNPNDNDLSIDGDDNDDESDFKHLSFRRRKKRIVGPPLIF